MATSAKPAPVRMAARRLSSPKANGPGASGLDGGRGGKRCAVERIGSESQRLSAGLRQQAKAMRPPAFSERLRLAKAASGCSKNITPKREKSTSTGSGEVHTCPSPCTKLAFLTPLASAAARASSSSMAEASSPVIRPDPIRPAISMVVSPQPHPTSSTTSPSLNSALTMAVRPMGSSCRSSRPCSCRQVLPMASFHRPICSALGEVDMADSLLVR